MNAEKKKTVHYYIIMKHDIISYLFTGNHKLKLNYHSKVKIF